MNLRVLACSLCSTVVFLAQASLQAAGLSSQQQEWLRAAGRHERAGWTYLHVEGEPRECGFQHGYLMAREIGDCFRIVKYDWKQQNGMEWNWLVENTKQFIQPAIDKENRAELSGIVEGMNAAGVPITYDDLVTYNAEIELESYWWPVAQKTLTDNGDFVRKPRQSCSSFIATGRMTADGGVVLGHNTMGDYIEAFANVIIDIKPAHGHRILMQTQPGWIHSGTDFFITDAGLVGSETTIGGFEHFSEKGIPEFTRMRRAIQDASNIDEWCAIMRKGNNGGYANSWLLGDVNTGEIARLELGLKYVGFERKKDGFFTGSNVAEDLRILRLETNLRDDNISLSPIARRVRWRQLMKQNAGKIDIGLAEKMEADCFDVTVGRENPGARTLSGHFELDPNGETSWSGGGGVPFLPQGTFDGKVVDSRMAKRMSFAARWGSSDGTAFDATSFLAAHPQFEWQAPYLKSRPAEPWVEFESGE